MSDYDPFGGTTDKSFKKNKSTVENSELLKKIKPIIIILIILGILSYIVYLIFFNYATVNVNVYNTEGEILNVGNISFRKLGKQDTQTFSLTEPIKIKKGIYSYRVVVSGYKIYSKENESFKDSKKTISEIILEKNINLAIDDFRFITTGTFFNGQKVEAEITLKNTSTTEDYSLSMISFEGSAKDWNYYYFNEQRDILDKETINISRSSTRRFFLIFEIPDNESLGTKTVTPKIKYLFTDDSLKKELTVASAPQINISCININETYIFGAETKNIICEIDNSRNQLTINDLTIIVDVNSQDSRNDVSSWLRPPQSQILVNQLQKKQEIIQLIVPSENVYSDTLTGKIIFESIYLENQRKEIDIEIVFNEPDISFEVTTTKNTLTVDYYSQNNSVSEEIIILKLNNKNNFLIKVLDINILSPGLTKDCENLIYYDEILATGNILSKTIKDIPLTITILNKLLLDITQDITRPCTLKIILENPFRDEETLEYSTNLQITTKIVSPPETE